MPDTSSDKRLDGWKAIANYFRRDRTTVMRWARERDLPVHRLPGGVQGSVFALESELARWAIAYHDVAAEPLPEPAPGTAAPPADVPQPDRKSVV